jgi:plastocyanin
MEISMSVFSKPGAPARWLLVCALAGCLIGPVAAWSDGGPEVGIDNFKFGPAALTVATGTEVTWTNHDDIPHSIVVNALGVHSKALDTDKAFTYKFDKAGTFFYVCGLHPFMQAKVVVK